MRDLPEIHCDGSCQGRKATPAEMGMIIERLMKSGRTLEDISKATDRPMKTLEEWLNVWKLTNSVN